MRNLNLRQFLLLGGIILVVLGVAGLTVLGPTPAASLLGDFFWLDGTENVAHLLFGVVALAAYYMLKDPQMTKILVILVGVVALVAALAGFMNGSAPVPNVGITNLENPADNILHLVVAAWAFYVAFMGDKKMA
ncbi:DUF4383 domain-containing protein [Candidatus Daviesbacteria bacterium]|nr:DUF4383 domain-containing protein [Candidatus Daviesbacteria bacterium]